MVVFVRTDAKSYPIVFWLVYFAVREDLTGSAIARVLLPEIQAFFESEEGQREYAEWKAKQQAEQKNKV